MAPETTYPAAPAAPTHPQRADAARLRDEARQVRTASSVLPWVLALLGLGSLAFTMVNVFTLAVKHGVPREIAWLLDPLMSISLLAVLIGDSVLSRFGVRSPAWAQTLKYAAGLATLAMNIWQPVADHDRAGVLIHASVPALLVLLAEATPAIRRLFSDLADDLHRRALAAELDADEKDAANVRRKAIDDAATAAEIARLDAERKAAEKAARAADKDTPKTTPTSAPPPPRRTSKKDAHALPPGLTPNEIAVYSIMLGRGQMTRASIFTDSGLPERGAKDALERLCSRGLVASVSRGVYETSGPADPEPEMDAAAVAETAGEGS